jgi:hypothetical protein
MIIFNFDVLARPGDGLGSRQPVTEGRDLWRMFFEKSVGRIALVVDDDVNREIFEVWLKKEGYKPAIYEVLDTKDPVLKAEKVQLLATSFGKASWYIDSDPATCARTMRLGVPTLMVCVPWVVRPEWHEERVPRDWDDIVTETTRQAVIRAEKTWGDYQ